MEKYIPTDSEWDEAKKTMTNTEAAASELREEAYGDALASGITREEIPRIRFTKTLEEDGTRWRGRIGDHEVDIKLMTSSAEHTEATVNGTPIDRNTALKILNKYNKHLFDEQGPLGYGVGIEEDGFIKNRKRQKDLEDLLPPEQKHPADNY